MAGWIEMPPGKNFRRPQIFSLEISAFSGPKVVLYLIFVVPGGPGPCQGRALRLQPHQPHGWSGPARQYCVRPLDSAVIVCEYQQNSTGGDLCVTSFEAMKRVACGDRTAITTTDFSLSNQDQRTLAWWTVVLHLPTYWPGLYLTGVSGVWPPQEVADPQKVMQNLFGWSTLTP